MSGAQGHTGPTGITGRRGLQGTWYGAAGSSFYSSTGTVPTTQITSSATVTYANAGGIYNIQGTSYTDPLISFPTSLTSDQYGTFWTFNNTTGQAAQRILLNTGVYKLTLPGQVLTCSTGQQIALYIYPTQSITFVFVAGSGTTAEFIAF